MVLDEKSEDLQSDYNLSWRSTQERQSQTHDGARGKVRGFPKPAGHVIRGAWISVQNFVPTHQVDVEIFHRIGEDFDLLVALDERAEDPQSQ